ncbi:hypothetical protein [Butyrivibrio sp. TB]|uniref:hypothetical protein n=1 Tax=Butyrivibrio sp. TB TaxID=1520809 RepID=UPI0008CAF5C8|nr:hypothetical protein [Butyrivibrio sp. TB]SEQ15284.1 hypothetical protein SAMN02910382_02180 [Butyrivibrio sp. TB]
MIFAIITLALLCVVELIVLRMLWKRYVHNMSMNKKSDSYFYLLKIWMKKRNQEKSIGDYLKKHRITHVAIYGNGEMGMLLCEELEHDKIRIDYIIDQSSTRSDYTIVKCDNTMPVTDAIIVTPYLEYDQIFEKLSSFTDAEIVSLEDIIFDY